MKAYISISFKKRKSLQPEIDAIKDVLKNFDIEPLIFVDKYNFDAEEERIMMQQAMADIDRCDMIIAETSDKAIGIGVEVGYAKAKDKPVIYLRNKKGAHSTTVSGISDFQIIYENPADLKEQLTKMLLKITQSNI